MTYESPAFENRPRLSPDDKIQSWMEAKKRIVIVITARLAVKLAATTLNSGGDQDEK